MFAKILYEEGDYILLSTGEVVNLVCGEEIYTPEGKVTTENLCGYSFVNNLNEAVSLFKIRLKNDDSSIWHDESCSIRIRLSFEDNLKMIQEYPELAVYIKQNNINSFLENGCVYIYVNELFPEHEYLLRLFNADIVIKES